MPTERQVHGLLDHEQIRTAMAVYARSADQYEPQQQAGVFVDDCRVRYHPDQWVVGRASLVEALHVALAEYTRASHHLGTVGIDFTGPDDAAAQSTVRDESRLPTIGRATR